MNLDELKKLAGIEAAKQVQDGMAVGLGTGSTAAHVVNELGRRVKEEGLRFTGVPTSIRTAELATTWGITLVTLEEQPALDLAIDGADEIELGSLALIKGAGGALLREKLVEVAATKLVIVADETKKVDKLGERFPIPVEVVRFGWKSTLARLEALGIKPQRRASNGEPYITDEQHYILDCHSGPIDDPARLAEAIKATAGVVEHGLFIGLAHQAIVATKDGIETLTP